MNEWKLIDRHTVEDFLYHEAALLDAWELDDWLALFTRPLRYVVPCTDTPDGDPARDLVLIDDDELRLSSRVERLNSRKAYREFPHSRTNHQVHNVVLEPLDSTGSEPELPVNALFTVWRFRNGKSIAYVGRYHYRLVLREDQLRIRSKRAVLDLTELSPTGDLAILL